ncbi:MAG: hypothetical protein J7501_14800 [Bdellovibrio sp.]|nr:hypothetical protein [Bdellovibrio sp.]
MSSGAFGDILILKSHASDFSQLEMEFQKCGAILRSTTELQQCLTLIAVHTPRFVMIDLDFPHQEISKLPILLSNQFPITTCGILHERSNRAMAQFIGSGLREKIFPPLSALNVLKQLDQFHTDRTLLSKTTSWRELNERCQLLEEILQKYDSTFKPGGVLELAQLLQQSMEMVMQTIHQMPTFRTDQAS